MKYHPNPFIIKATQPANLVSASVTGAEVLIKDRRGYKGAV